MRFERAKSLLILGLKVRRPSWLPGSYWVLSKDKFKRIMYSDGTSARIHVNQIEAIDWELFTEEKSLSDKECNILTRIVLPIEVSKPIMTDTKTRFVVTEKGEMKIEKGEMKIEKGFFKDDVKDFIKECKKQIMEKGRRFNIYELAGDKLCSK